MGTVLCAIDFSPTTELVVRAGQVLAEAWSARLIAFHAVHFARDPLYATDLFDRRTRSRRLAEEAHRRLTECMAPVDLAWEPVVVHGDPVEQLSALASTLEFSIVVTASQGIRPFERLFVGTVVERMVQKIPRPILIIHPSPADLETPNIRLSRILVGCDLHPPAAPLETTCLLARHFASEVHLLHVSESPLDEPLVKTEHGPAAQGFERMRQKLCQQLQDACPETRARGVRFHADIQPGVPAEVLRDCARQRETDLLVVGVHRTGAIKRALIGSTARDLLRNAPCHLLTVPQADSDPQGAA